jgi:FkbM family methyltransferase
MNADARLRSALQEFSRRTAFKGRTRLVRALGRRILPAERFALTRLPDGTQMRLDLDDPLQFDMFYDLYESELRAWVCALLRPGDVMFDLGAHVGYYTLAAAQRVGARGMVHAFEALPMNADALQTNVQINHWTNVRVNRAAVTDTNGSIDLHIPVERDHNASGAATIMEFFPDAKMLRVPAVAVDDYIAENGVGHIALVKMDIEAAEVRALRGMQRVLQTQPPCAILAEVNTIRLRDSGYAPDVLHTTLAVYGYTAWQIQKKRLARCHNTEMLAPVSNVLFLAPNHPLVQRGAMSISLDAVRQHRIEFDA